MTQIVPASDADATEPTFAESWAALQPGERASKGVYSVYKTHENSLLISYRPETLPDDAPPESLEIPPALMVLLVKASEGKLSPMEMLGALKSLRGGFGG